MNKKSIEKQNQRRWHTFRAMTGYTLIEVVVIVFIFLLIGGLFFSVRGCFNAIENAGGPKQIAIEVGKDIKDIANEIQKD